MSDDINQKIPVYIANLAVSNLEQKIATLESKNQILRQEYTALVHERGDSIKKLEAENERLKENINKLCNHGDLEIARLTAENERLRKAGDAMYHTAQQDGTGLWLHKSFQDWNAAKEGGRK